MRWSAKSRRSRTNSADIRFVASRRDYLAERALAEQEREFISKRTKAALQMAKERGQQLGGLRDKTMKRNEAIQRKANAEAEKLIKIIGPLREAGQTLAAIAGTLNDMNVETSRGGTWTPMQVKRVLDRIGA